MRQLLAKSLCEKNGLKISQRIRNEPKTQALFTISICLSNSNNRIIRDMVTYMGAMLIIDKYRNTNATIGGNREQRVRTHVTSVTQTSIAQYFKGLYFLP